MAFHFDPTLQQVLITVLIFLVTWFAVRRRRHQQAIKFPPGTHLPHCLPSVPILGSLPFMNNNPSEIHCFFMEQALKRGNVFGLYMGPRYAVVLNGFETIREALLKKSLHFAGRTPFYLNTVENPDRKGIIAAPYDDAFRTKRKLYLSILREFGFGKRLMETRINVEVAEFVKQARSFNGQPFEPRYMMHTCVANVTMNILLGRRYPYGHPSLDVFRQRLRNWFDCLVQEVEVFNFLRFVPPYRGRIQKYLNAVASWMSLVEHEVDITLWEADHEEGEKKDSFVKRFVELTSMGTKLKSLANAEFDRKELCEALHCMFAGGDDTSSTTLLGTLVELANHQDIQSRLHKEIDEVVGTARLPLLEDQYKMPYTQAVVLESLRRYTVIPLSPYRETTCDTQVGDCFIPEKTVVIPNLYSAHMDPAKWSEPKVFKPERFIDENGQVTDRDRIVSFALGKRACIGESLGRQTLFLFLAGLVQNFQILPPEGQQKVVVTETVAIDLMLSEFNIRMIPRKL